MKSNSSNSNIFFRWMHLCFFRLSPFLRSVHQLSAEFKTNVYTSIVSSCSSEASPTVFLLSGDVRGTQQGLCEALQTAHWSLSACVYTLRYSESVRVFLFRVGFSELLLWWRPLWLDQGQGWGPTLGDDTWPVRYQKGWALVTLNTLLLGETLILLSEKLCCLNQMHTHTYSHICK